MAEGSEKPAVDASERKFVAFLDALGFKNVLNDWEMATKALVLLQGGPLVRQDAHDFSVKSFTHAYPDVTNGRFEAAPESKVKNAKQILLYALGFLCFSQKLRGKIFNLFRFRVSPCFLNVGIVESMSDCYFHFLASNWVKTG